MLCAFLNCICSACYASPQISVPQFVNNSHIRFEKVNTKVLIWGCLVNLWNTIPPALQLLPVYKQAPFSFNRACSLLQHRHKSLGSPRVRCEPETHFLCNLQQASEYNCTEVPHHILKRYGSEWSA